MSGRAADSPCSVEGCMSTQGRKGARGLCSRHYQRLLSTGSPTGSNRPTPEERFFAKVVVTPSGCWLWNAARDEDGYGLFSGRPAGGTVRAHIWSYEHHVGPIPARKQIDHTCRKRSCVRPDHLEPVTSRENSLRGDTVYAINAAKTHCKRGHEFTTTNTYRTVTGSRSCRTCLAIHRAKHEKRSA